MTLIWISIYRNNPLQEYPNTMYVPNKSTLSPWRGRGRGAPLACSSLLAVNHWILFKCLQSQIFRFCQAEYRILFLMTGDRLSEEVRFYRKLNFFFLRVKFERKLSGYLGKVSESLEGSLSPTQPIPPARYPSIILTEIAGRRKVELVRR